MGGVNFMNQYEEYLSKIFKKKNTVYVADELYKILIDEFSISNENARKILSNAVKNDVIKNSAPITFGDNKYAYFSNKCENSYGLLADKIKKCKPSLFRIILAFSRNDNILTKNEICKVSGCRLTDSVKAITFADVINDLNYLNILRVEKVNNISFYCLNTEKFDAKKVECRYTQLEEEGLTFKTLLSWLENTNLSESMVAYKGKKNVEEEYLGVITNNLVWDGVAYSNLNWLHEKTMVMIDCLLNRKYEAFDADGFIERLKASRFSVKTTKRNQLPIVFAIGFTPQATKKLMEYKVICFNVESILGYRYKYIVSKYIEIDNSFTNDFDNIKDTYHIETTKLLETINTNANFNNLKGHLFEYIMGVVFDKIYNERGTRISHSVRGKANSDEIVGEFECDYVIDTYTEEVVIELKGYKADTVIPLGNYKSENKVTIKHFLDNTFARYRSWRTDKQKHLTFCYITTSKIEDKAKVKMQSMKKFKPSKLEHYYESDDLVALLKEYDCKNELEIVQQFYLK